MDENEGMVRLHIVSDLPESRQAVLTMKIMTFEGQELWKESLPVDIPARSSAIYVEKGIGGYDIGKTMLVASLATEGNIYDSGLHYFTQPKNLKLTDPGITVEVSEKGDVFEITLASVSLARNVFLTAEGFMGQFSDNFFDILPGEKVSVTFPKSGNPEDFKDHLKLMHLQQTM